MFRTSISAFLYLPNILDIPLSSSVMPSLTFSLRPSPVREVSDCVVLVPVDGAVVEVPPAVVVVTLPSSALPQAAITVAITAISPAIAAVFNLIVLSLPYLINRPHPVRA